MFVYKEFQEALRSLNLVNHEVPGMYEVAAASGALSAMNVLEEKTKRVDDDPKYSSPEYFDAMYAAIANSQISVIAHLLNKYAKHVFTPFSMAPCIEYAFKHKLLQSFKYLINACPLSYRRAVNPANNLISEKSITAYSNKELAKIMINTRNKKYSYRIIPGM